MNETFKALMALLLDHRKWEVGERGISPSWKHENGTEIYTKDYDMFPCFYVAGLVVASYPWPGIKYHRLRRALDRMQASKLTNRQLDDFSREVPA